MKKRQRQSAAHERFAALDCAIRQVQLSRSQRTVYTLVTVRDDIEGMISHQRRDELPGLTGLRGLAALAVLGFHTHLWGFGYGYLGVDIFFILSGFVLSYVSQTGVSPGSFLWARFARTLPTHWVATTAVGIAVVVYGHATMFDVVLNLFGLRIVNSPTWSLIVEWYAYLLFPIVAIMPGIKRLPASLIISIGAIGGIIGLFTSTIGTWQWPFQTLRGLSEFALGVGLFRAGWLPRSRVWTVLDCQPIRWLGDISYPLYLTNFLPILIITNDGRRPITIMISIISVITTLALAALLHYFVESPARRWLRSFSLPTASLGVEVASGNCPVVE